MKTKVVLHGGFTPGQSQEDDVFFGEVLKDTPEEAKVLLVYFAKEADRIEKNKAEDIEQFTKNKKNGSLVFEVATEEGFVDQIKNADVVYFHGGHTGKLLETLKQMPRLDWLGALVGKIVAGDSAGANVLASLFSSQRIGVAEGFGFVPIKFIAHYSEDKKNNLDGMRSELETVFLAEYQTKVFWV